MADKTVNAKVLQVALTTAQWATEENAAKVISKGQVVVEYATDGKTKMKVGDGINTFANLPYAAGGDLVTDKTLTQENMAADAKAVGDALGTINNAMITAVTINNVAVTVNNGTAELPAYPTSVESANQLTTARTINLTGDVTGTVTTNFSDTVNITTTVNTVEASTINGVINIENLPHGALERLCIVADDTARFALTTDDVQNGDTVKVVDTDKLYYVKDDTNLDSEAGYEPYSNGTATSVPWSGVTGKPDTFPPSAHTHTLSDITDYVVDNVLNNASNRPVENQIITNALANKVDVVAGKGLSTEDYTTADKDKLANISLDVLNNVVTGVKGDADQTYQQGPNVSIGKANIGLANVTDNKQINAPDDAAVTQNNVAVWGANGVTLVDGGITVADITNSINNVAADVVDVSNNVANVAANVTALGNEINNVSANVTAVANDVANVAADVANVSNRVTTIEEDYLKSTDTLILNCIL